MATFRQRGATWRAELYKHGRRESATFATKRQAVAWATQREAELASAKPLPASVESKIHHPQAERNAAQVAAAMFCAMPMLEAWRGPHI